jgi:hypothetical protein
MRSTLTDTVTVHTREVHRPIAPGDEVDFDETVAPGLTLEQALGPHTAARFESCRSVVGRLDCAVEPAPPKAARFSARAAKEPPADGAKE